MIPTRGKPTVMIIESAIRLAFAAGCLTAIVTLPTAHAQMGAPGGYGYAPPPGAAYGYGPPAGPYGYGPPPGAYGYGAPPGPYGYGSPPGAYGYGPPQGTHPAPGAYGQSPGAYGQSPGTYGAPPGPYTPQTQYVAPLPPGTQLITNGPQTNAGDVSPSWSAQRNVTESEQYDR
jgi:hypothetical protein